MGGERRTALTAFARPLGLQVRIGLLLLGLDLGQRRLEVLQRQGELLGIELLRAAAHVHAAELAGEVLPPGHERLQAGELGFQPPTLDGARGPLLFDLDPFGAQLRDLFGLRTHQGAQGFHVVRELGHGQVHGQQ